ncbi:hypothetical protein COEREDRAFT_91037 [Coemansia reversa NRRL 1564]|uniref:Uncharacterized protein n=1 Tax=Coemansia reversa (strain ATCC 12441 / NRRL 1564) TaxID=763665 RepID=A0A2G5BHZ3_COERN|nr:hypothetical protein COEREDRAFT_91037 [Coemansia reversa NRRL 1564]|eukprot:PIA18629.1 hypothetical protein COEREDRAFT_91037 [Coemansia reversa NRRL 1564]
MDFELLQQDNGGTQCGLLGLSNGLKKQSNAMEKGFAGILLQHGTKTAEQGERLG